MIKPVPTLSIRADYRVCQAETSEFCPTGSVWIACDKSFAECATTECGSFSITLPKVAPTKSGEFLTIVAGVQCSASTK